MDHRARISFGTTVIIIIFALSPSWLIAQLEEGTILTYRFSLESEINAEQVKELDRIFNQSEPENCYYIKEADCFKWSTSERVSYQELSNRLEILGYQLSPKVLRSDGVYLTAEYSNNQIIIAR